jgi:hypothetical protein
MPAEMKAATNSYGFIGSSQPTMQQCLTALLYIVWGDQPASWFC